VRASAGAASFRRQPTLEKHLAAAQATLAAQETEASLAGAPLSPRQQAAQARAAREKVARLEAALAEMPAARAAKATAAEQEQARVSTTDALARVMKMADGGYRPAYNWQFAVETRHLIITGVDVVNIGSDKGQLLPMLEQVKTRCQRLPANWLADGGFVNLTAFGLADDIVMNYVLTCNRLPARAKVGQAHKTRLTNCIQGMFPKSAPANSSGERPARLAPLRKRQQLRVMAQAFRVARPLSGPWRVCMLSCLRFKNFIHWSRAVVTTASLSSVIQAWKRVCLVIRESLREAKGPSLKASGNSAKACWYAWGDGACKTRLKARRIWVSSCPERGWPIA
jgi:hypothetical protein